MKQSEIQLGACYLAKVSGAVVPVRVDEIDAVPGNRHQKARTVYHCTNLKTKRKVTIDSAQRFREASPTGSSLSATGPNSVPATATGSETAGAAPTEEASEDVNPTPPDGTEKSTATGAAPSSGTAEGEQGADPTPSARSVTGGIRKRATGAPAPTEEGEHSPFPPVAAPGAAGSSSSAPTSTPAPTVPSCAGTSTSGDTERITHEGRNGTVVSAAVNGRCLVLFDDDGSLESVEVEYLLPQTISPSQAGMIVIEGGVSVDAVTKQRIVMPEPAVDTSPLREGETPEDRLLANVGVLERTYGRPGETIHDLAKRVTKHVKEGNEEAGGPDEGQERSSHERYLLQGEAARRMIQQQTDDLIADAGAKGHTVTRIQDEVIIEPGDDMHKDRADFNNLPPPATQAPRVSPQKESVGALVARRLKEAKERANREPERQDVSAPVHEAGGVPDSQKSDVRQLVRRPGAHLIVRARAGTGKTTTLVEGMKLVRGLKSDLTPSPQQEAVWQAMAESAGVRSVGFCAFNSSIAEELRRRVPPGCDATTMHGMGFKAVLRAFGLSGRDVVNKYNVSELCAELQGCGDYRELQQHRAGFYGTTGLLQSVVKFCKMRLVGVDEKNRFDAGTVDWGVTIRELCDRYDLDATDRDLEDLGGWVPRILDLCLDPSRRGCLDYDDQIWLAVMGNVRLWEYDLLCVDEAQDLNPAQQRLVRKAGRRLAVVGDNRQAIYAFTGGDTEGLDTFETVLGATSKGCQLLPLTVTRRCGKAVVEEAKKLVPDFEAHESNGPGLVARGKYQLQQTGNYWTGGGKTERLAWDQCYLKDVAPGDLVVCRVNAPLVQQCVEHHKRGNRAFILGREYGERYRTLIEKQEAKDVVELVAKMSDWRVEELRKEQAKRRPSDSRILNIEGVADTILALAEGMKGVGEVLERVDQLFVKDANRPGVLHSSIHKAKGLEAPNVWFLMPRGAGCPHPMAKSEWAIKQEWNLKYVGITRAIETMTYVS